VSIIGIFATNKTENQTIIAQRNVFHFSAQAYIL